MQRSADPPELSRLAADVLQDMQDRRELLESGEARFWRLFRRPVNDGEQVTLNPPIVNVMDAPAAIWAGVLTTAQRGQGPALDHPSPSGHGQPRSGAA